MTLTTVCVIFLATLVSLSRCYTDADQGDICIQPKETGHCGRSKTMYYHNTATGECEQFTYSGCGGNQNQFKTKSECVSACVCSKPKNIGRCNNFVQAYYFNTVTNKCEEFTYGGCAGNSNRFTTLKGCQKQCVCDLEPEIGPCKAAMRMTYYNSKTGTCKPFLYGGCQGNGNRFETERECQTTCKR